MRASLASVAAIAALLLAGCRRTGDDVARLAEGLTPEQVLRALGPPIPDHLLPAAARALPMGCASHLIYEDQFHNPVVRTLANGTSAQRTLLHVCFDTNGRSMSGIRFTLITP